MEFTEDFLHYLWRFRLFLNVPLYCTSGERLEVIYPGTLNTDAGPDFSQAKIQIGDTIWAGNVEIHIYSSDWFLHNHQIDPVYDSVILHVVFEDDRPVCRGDGSLIPSFILKGLYAGNLLNNYNNLINNLNFFPCEKHIIMVEQIFVNSFLSRTLAERLQEKSIDIMQKLSTSNGNWDEVFYAYLARGFGFKVNSLPFELLANALPYHLLAKHKDQPEQIEALIFGQAGFLQQVFKEAYPISLQREYRFLKKKYGLKAIDVSLWKFLRMRPDNFPTIRLAQFSALMIRSNHLFSLILKLKEKKEVKNLFENLEPASYWSTHYHFGKETRFKSQGLGTNSIHNLIINTVCLFLYAYGSHLNDEQLVGRAFKLLEELPAEQNAIVQKFRNAGVVINSAYASQSVLQLNKNYCSLKKCLHCSIGVKILNK
jgi:hypothetical protein